MVIEITSAAFEDGDAIPARYTCEGADVSPPLRWERSRMVPGVWP
jgi:phosphatidylethanolamine-binding protein (PEBP) family uncharacterized protein